MKVFIFLKIIIISFVLTSCFEQTRTPYENYISCLKELPDKSGNKTIHESICFNKYSREGYGENVNGTGYTGFQNSEGFNSYKIINKSSDIIKVNQISNIIENKNNPEESVVATLNCEQKQIGPFETTVVKCFYTGAIAKKDFKQLFKKLPSKDKETSWDIVSTSHLSP